MNIRYLLPEISGAKQFPKSAVRRIHFLIQSVSHQKLNEHRFCRGTHRSYEVRPVKILGFHKAFVDQDLISESLRTSEVHIVTFQLEAGRICTFLQYVIFGLLDSLINDKNPLLSFLRKTRHSSAQLCPRQQTKLPKAGCSCITESPECH